MTIYQLLMLTSLLCAILSIVFAMAFIKATFEIKKELSRRGKERTFWQVLRGKF